MSSAMEDIHRFEQTARFRDIAPLALKNAFLGLITLTLYRFWARTDVRRRLWSTTRILGDPLEYGGSGWELFRGFLISIPVFFLPAIGVLYIAPLVMDRDAAALLVLGFYVFAVPMIALARYLMRRYQLSRTRWRGIRFALAGSPLEFAAFSMGWSILEAVTFGWYGPAARMRRAKLMWENTRFGDQPFEFAVGENQLAKGLGGPFALAWFAPLIAFLIASMASGIALGVIYGFAGGPPSPSEASLTWQTVFTIVIFVVAFAVAWVFLVTPYNAAAMNRTAELLSLDGARFRLRTDTGGLFAVTLAAGAIFVLTLGALAPVSGALYLRYVIRRLEVAGAPRFTEIGQTEIASPRSGEGFADAFDLDFGVGVV